MKSDESRATPPSRLTADGLELSIATQRAREKLGELDVTVSIPGFIDLCQLAIKGIVASSERAPTVLDAVAWRYRISDGQPWYYSGHNPRGDVPEGWIVEPLFPAPEAPK